MLGDENSVLEADGPLVWALDDEPMTLSLLEDVLCQGGYRYKGFLHEDGLFEALEHSTPDLLLLDWMLPGSSGHDVLKRWVMGWPHIPVVVITALSGESVLFNAFESGACDVLRKPFDVTELMVRIHRQLMERSHTHNTHVHSLRQDRLVAFSCELMTCLDEPACWHALDQLLSEHMNATLFLKRDGEFGAYRAPQVLSLSRCEAPWNALMRGEGVWLQAHERSKLSLDDVDQEAFVAPLHDGKHLHGVLWWRGERHERAIASFLIQAAHITMTMVGRLRTGPIQTRNLAATEDSGTFITREFLDRIIEASPDAIVAADRKGRIILFNAAAERILQWERELALGGDVRNLYQEGVAYQIMQRLQADEEGGWGKLSKCREVLLTHGREEIPVELSAALIVRGEQVLGTVGLFRDIRERIAIEGQLERATQDLAAHREQVVMAEMAGATAHELNQPLTSMLNYVEVLLADETLAERPRTKRAVDVIARDASKLAEIVKQIGQITRYRTRSYVDDTRILDLGEDGQGDDV